MSIPAEIRVVANQQERKRIKISGAMRRAFHDNAPAALNRRNDAYLISTLLNVCQWILIGALGLCGLKYWHWSSADLLLVFVTGILSSILVDVLRWLLARRQMREDYALMMQDRLVWVVAEAIHGERSEIHADRIEPVTPGKSLLLDLVAAAVGIWLLAVQAGRLDLEDGIQESLNGSSGWAAIIVLLAPLVSMLVATFSRAKATTGFDDLEFRAGGRGIGLILLAGALWFFDQDGQAAGRVMGFINGTTVVVGVMALVGVWIMKRERDWLRRWLQQSTGNESKRSRADSSGPTI